MQTYSHHLIKVQPSGIRSTVFKYYWLNSLSHRCVDLSAGCQDTVGCDVLVSSWWLIATVYPWKLCAVRHTTLWTGTQLMTCGHIPLDVLQTRLQVAAQDNTCFSPAQSYVHRICKLTIQNYFYNWLWSLGFVLSEPQARSKPNESPSQAIPQAWP